MGATIIGRDLGPRVSSALGSGLTADCTSLEIGDHEDKKSWKKIMRTFSIKYVPLLVEILWHGSLTPIIVRRWLRYAKGYEKEIYDLNYKGEKVEYNVKDFVKEEDFIVSIIDRHVEKSKVNIKNSPIIVSGGYGVGSKENFQMLYQLADVLGAEVGASRAAVDAGFVEHERQVGQTGVTVRPKVYIACGISGQIQHIAGMQDSSIIISINNDPNAPINAIADYVITGEIEQVIPKMIKYYKKNTK